MVVAWAEQAARDGRDRDAWSWTAGWGRVAEQRRPGPRVMVCSSSRLPEESVSFAPCQLNFGFQRGLGERSEVDEVLI